MSIPTVEVHISNIHAREDFRKVCITTPACIGQITGLGKYKTTSQMIVVIIALAIGPVGFYISDYFFTIAEVLMLIPVILTIWSGWEYTFKAKHYFTEQ